MYSDLQIAEFPNARSEEAIKALAIYRGTTVNMKAAEAFSIVRKVLRYDKAKTGGMTGGLVPNQTFNSFVPMFNRSKTCGLPEKT